MTSSGLPFQSSSQHPKLYPSLGRENVSDTAPTRPLRICIVASHIAGPAKTSGLGTAYMALAEALAGDGHCVTILYLRGTKSDQYTIDFWIDEYRHKKIELIPLPAHAELDRVPPYSRIPFEAYLWVRAQPAFDLIHYADCYGVGYYLALAKRHGLALAGTLLCAGTHGASEWLNFLNAVNTKTEATEAHARMERRSVEWADIVISPSHFMLRRLEGLNWRFPARRYVQQNIMPPALVSLPTSAKNEQKGIIREIAFFGRLEHGKGLALFCTALDILAKDQRTRGTTITFLGSSVKMADGLLSADYIKARAGAWQFPVQILTDKGHRETQDYLRRDGLLAVVPSLGENSPYAVLECIAAGTRFLASAVGGIPELIRPDDVADVCFDPQPEGLADRLKTIIQDGLKNARPATDFAENRRDWINWHRSLAT